MTPCILLEALSSKLEPKPVPKPKTKVKLDKPDIDDAVDF